MKHLLSIEKLRAQDIQDLIHLGIQLKASRGKARHPKSLKNQTWALIFAKSSTRTRVSFEVGIRELGGECIFLDIQDIQLGRGESVEDTARVLSRYLHGIIIRTFSQNEVETLAELGSIPVINALTDDEHPCQILADLMTWVENLSLKSKKQPKNLCTLFHGKIVTFFGDAACNVARSWIFAASKLGFTLRLAAPKNFQPSNQIIIRAGYSHIQCYEDPRAAAESADLLYTDTWVSMGKEKESKQRIIDLSPYQINSRMVHAAKPNALVMHCLPAYRGQEISAEIFESFSKTIFDEAENRLHIQKAILSILKK